MCACRACSGLSMSSSGSNLSTSQNAENGALMSSPSHCEASTLPSSQILSLTSVIASAPTSPLPFHPDNVFVLTNKLPYTILFRGFFPVSLSNLLSCTQGPSLFLLPMYCSQMHGLNTEKDTPEDKVRFASQSGAVCTPISPTTCATWEKQFPQDYLSRWRTFLSKYIETCASWATIG